MSATGIREESAVQRDGGGWLPEPDRKRLLVIVHTEVYGKRLQDLLPLLESDLRIEVAFTVPPHAFNGGTARFLRALGATVIGWEEAVRGSFDLALAAGSQGTERLRAPLVRLSHGAGQMSLTRRSQLRAGESRAPRGVTARGYLTWEGRVVPRAVVLAHHEDLTELERWCPEALPAAEVVGDPCFDRIRHSLPLRREYRGALGLAAGQKLVLVSLSWGERSSFNRLGSVLPRLLAELPPDEFRTALLVHPNVWSRFGHWQVRAWLGDCRRSGITVLAPETDWRQPLIAADWIVGDYGSVTLYGTMTGSPILMTHFPYWDANPHSPGVDLALTAPALSPSRPLAEQLAFAAAEYRAEDHAGIAARLSSEPGRFNHNFRRLMYRVLGLGQPAYPPATEPLPLPAPLEPGRASWGEAV